MKKLYSLLAFLAISNYVAAQSEPSTYFNVYVPPNNEAMQRNVAIVVTAIDDSTTFSIVDDGADGDSDDNVTGMLMAGQSYVLYIKDNGINDDALYASGGTLKRDGDYFIINSDKLLYACMSTDSDWQHDFVPSVNKKTVGQKFYVYSPKVSQSPRDLNVFAYETATTVSIYKVFTSPTTQTGYTNINLETKQLVVQKTLNPGQDIIHHFPEGRDLMVSGGTYLIQSNKDISVQYGALWGNSRDGGAYVPSSNGSGSGELFYFAVPYQVGGEQEIRIVSWDNNNTVQLSRYHNGSWVNMNSWTLNEMQPADWVGKQNGNTSFPTVFRVTCSAGKRVSVMEANWMETGSNNTSDMATMVSAESGTSSGKRFLAYMLPPSRQNNVINPANGQFFPEFVSHFYLFAGNQSSTVTIKDAKTNGQVLSKTYQIEAGRYADAFFTLSEWKRIYNGTGTPVGPDRPYVIIEASEHIAVLLTNFNDNWMTYFGSSLPQSFTQTGNLSSPVANPGQEVTLTSGIEIGPGQSIDSAIIEVKIASGLIPVSSNLTNNGSQVATGNITTTNTGSTVSFQPIPEVTATDQYAVETKVLVAPTFNNGAPITNEAVLTVETVVSGTVNGEFQQSNFSQGIQNNAANTSNLLYSACQVTTIAATANSSWNPSWVDYDNDGHEDLFIATKDASQKNEMYRNNGNGTFTKVLNNPLVNERANTVAAVWADINNNGRKDVLLVNATQHRSKLFLNNGNGDFTELKNTGLEEHPQYFHGAAFADFDNDGYVDLLMTNFFQTRFHLLYRNKGDNTFEQVNSTPITAESERAMAPILADYNNDGLVDVFIPNGNNRANSLFKNIGNFQFEKVLDSALNADTKNSVGAAWGDFNNDGFLDLLVVNASGENNDLYRNTGNGSFQKMESSIVSTQGGDSHGAAWFDVNNDGWLDIFITNDNGSSFLYLNNGSGGFTRKLDETISGNLGKSYGVAVGDHNKDGHLDLAISTHTNGNTRYFCNNGSEGNWIGFHLQGVYSNRQALGSRVAIKANGQWQHRQNLPMSGLGSQNSQFIHFGVHTASTIDSVLVVWPSGAHQWVTNARLNHYNVIEEQAAKVVTGLVFHDLDSNGLRDKGEPIVANVRMNLDRGKMNLASDEAGAFSFRTNSDTVHIQLNQRYWRLAANQASHTFARATDSLHILLPITAVELGHDLGISLSTTAWRRGFTNETILKISNDGTEMAENVQAELTFPEEAYLLRADKSFLSPVNKTYVWELGSLSPGGVTTINIVDSIGLTATTGQTLLVQANTFAPLGTELNLSNNKTAEEVEVVGAIDPNDILVSPKGDGPQGYIQPNQWLTYTIRFENVGTYKATYVFLENQLPRNLDLSTFEILASSHAYTYTLTEDGQLAVAYRYIYLPPAVEDSLGAHGYFKYRIKPMENLQGGSPIINNAKIIFDFEEPIVTNTVLNTIKMQGREAVKTVKVFPNPADVEINVLINEAHYRLTDPQVITTWAILDLHERLLSSGLGTQEVSMTLPIADLPAGIYLVRVTDQFGQAYLGKFLKY